MKHMVLKEIFGHPLKRGAFFLIDQLTLAEGIECEESHNMLRDMGMQLGQGYFYGKPASISKWVKKENDA